MRVIDCEELFPDGVFVVDLNDPEKCLDELWCRIQNAHMVDIVQCKDCKYFALVDAGIGVCNRKMIGTVGLDDFCSRGEKEKRQ